MYENQTQEVILKRMLDNVSDDVDKREGSIIYDATAPASIEFMLLYAMADYFLKNTFGDTADREYLIERAKERGLSPYPATYAVAKAVCTPAIVIVPIGTRFSYDDVNYRVTAQLAAGEYAVTCETVGTAGNLPAGQLVPIDYVKGLQTAQLVEITVPGEEEEDTEVFRQRYLKSFGNQAYGGNIQDYLEKVNAIPGVGGVKVYPIWDGGGTVKIVFMTSEYKVPTAEFVNEVQTAIDPVTNSGQGIGIAPIGHHVTVEGVKAEKVDIAVKVSTAGATSLDVYKQRILDAIDEYFLKLNKNWQDTKKDTITQSVNSGIIIRVSQIESRILDFDGIEDVEHTALNDKEENLTLDPDALAVRGDVTWL